MSETVLMTERGQITLPLKVRKKYALNKGTPLMIDETKDGLLLRKASMIPIRHYSEEDIRSFVEEDKILPRDKKWLK